MHKELLDALKAKFTGVSESILNRIAAKLAKTVTTSEEVATAVEGVTFQQVLESYGDSRATEAQQTAVTNYEKKYGLKDGAKVQPGGDQTKQGLNEEPGKPTEEVPAWAKALSDSIKSVSDRMTAMEGARIGETRKAQLAAITSKLPVSLQKAYERTPVESLTDEEFTALTNEISTEVGEIVKTSGAKGAVFGRPTVQGGHGSEDGELTKEQLDAINKRSGSPAAGSDAQPF